MRSLRALVCVGVLVVGTISTASVRAADDSRCFDVPGITDCIAGRFREYWEQNGGLAVFGYPITPATQERTAEGQFLTQYFERNRFELHPEKPRPYDILLGRLGDDRLRQQGRNWRDYPAGQRTDGCLWFEETRHSLCNLADGFAFKRYWEQHGLLDPALNGFQRSLALFGAPLSEVTVETNAAGDTVFTQWFERARFEYHPDKPQEFQVLLGLLGSETRTTTSPPPPAPPSPERPAACAGVPEPTNATLPDCIRYGETFMIGLYGFEPNQQVSIRLTREQGVAIGTAQSVQADPLGNVQLVVSTANYQNVELRPAAYLLEGTSTNGPAHSARAPFRVLP